MLALSTSRDGGVPVTVHSATIALLDGTGAVQSERTVEKPLGGTNRLAPTQELMTPAVTFESADGRRTSNGYSRWARSAGR